MVSTDIQKEEARNTREKINKKDKRRKNSREIGIQEILEVEKGIWKGRIRKSTHQKAIEPCNRVEREICVKEGESIFTIKGGKKEDTSIHRGSTAKEIYLAIKTATNLTSPFCSKEGQKEENGTKLLPYKSVNSKEWIPFISNCRYPRQSLKKRCSQNLILNRDTIM